MNECILHLGSNVNRPAHHLVVAEYLISKHIGVVTDRSGVYRTEPWGNKDQEDFLNIALAVATHLAPMEVFKKSQTIEKKMGRKKNVKWGPRIIDIDILFYNDEIIKNDKLIIPHPRLTNRNFVLIPLMDICPDRIHPESGKTISEILTASDDDSAVDLYTG